MNIIDIIFGGLILFGVVRGFMKGFFVETTSLLALVLGIYGAIHFSYIAGNYLYSWLDWDESYVNLIAFAITFGVIIVLVSLLGRMLTKLAEVVAMGIINRLIGGIFGGFKIALILGIVFTFFDKTSNSLFFFGEKAAEKSVLYKPVKELGEYVFFWALEEKQIEEDEEDYRNRNL